MYGGAYVALMMLTVVCIGVFLSTLTDSTAAAVVGTVVAIVTSNVLGALPGLRSVKPFLPTRYWDEWHALYATTTLQDMWKGVASTLIWSTFDHAARGVALPTQGHPVVVDLVCGRCGTVVAPDATSWRCPACGGPFSLASLNAPAPASLTRVTMGEGDTSLATIRVGDRDVLAKLEFEAPTGSFKDRGAASLVAAAVDVGATRLVADSSGNAGTAIAAYAARAGLPCEVFVSSALASSKVARINAQVVAVKGTREDIAAAAVARVEELGAFYASHVWNPWFFEGTKHYVRELYAQLGGRLPAALVLPAGNGTLVLGAWRALQELGAITPIIAVQAARCAPVAEAFAAGQEHVAPVIDQGTIAAGIAIAAPVRGDEVLAAVRATGGWFVTVTDEEISVAATQLAAEGFLVEPTGAAPAAALQHIEIDDAVIPIAAGA